MKMTLKGLSVKPYNATAAPWVHLWHLCTNEAWPSSGNRTTVYIASWERVEVCGIEITPLEIDLNMWYVNFYNLNFK